MKRLFLSASVVLTFAVYSFIRQGGLDATVTVPISSDGVPAALPDKYPPVTPSDTVPTAVPASPAPAQTARGAYRDGTYTGDSVDAFYGYVQVQATVRGGTVTDVQVLQYPNDRQTSVEINSVAMPILRQEAIRAQSARIDAVSGASDSSSAFIQSLDSALKKAI